VQSLGGALAPAGIGSWWSHLFEEAAPHAEPEAIAVAVAGAFRGADTRDSTSGKEDAPCHAPCHKRHQGGACFGRREEDHRRKKSGDGEGEVGGDGGTVHGGRCQAQLRLVADHADDAG
jgi:hypothetical protein